MRKKKKKKEKKEKKENKIDKENKLIDEPSPDFLYDKNHSSKKSELCFANFQHFTLFYKKKLKKKIPKFLNHLMP